MARGIEYATPWYSRPTPAHERTHTRTTMIPPCFSRHIAKYWLQTGSHFGTDKLCSGAVASTTQLTSGLHTVNDEDIITETDTDPKLYKGRDYKL